MRPVERSAVSAALCALDAELAKPWPEETAEEVARTFKRLARDTLVSARNRRIRYGQFRHMQRGLSRLSEAKSLALAQMYRRLAVEAMADAVSLREAA